MKKFLSLVLALVMTMSLVTISAGAKDFTDDEKIQYEEAIDVMSAVKVVDGYTDGSFKPQAQLNRGQAAKILCNMILGPTTASALKADSAPFKDVAVDSTFAGYIAYCAQAGIIDGYTDGTFRPAAPLTGYAFMKLLLGALGYDKDIEGYNIPNWSINVAKRALNIGLDKGLTEDFDGTKIVTREEACLFAFNTLKATMVEYGTKTTVNVAGAEVVIGGSAAKEVTTSNDTNKIKADGKVQFAEKYFTKLQKTSTTQDAFGRPATEWKYKTEVIGTYVNTGDLVASYTAGVSKGDLYTLVGKSVVDDLNGSADLSVYKNGSVVAPVVANFFAKNQSGSIAPSGNGTLTEVYVDGDNNTTIVSIQTYLVQAEADYDSKKETVKIDFIDENGSVKPAGFPSTISQEDFDVSEVKEDDYLLVTYSEDTDTIESVTPAETVKGTVETYTYGKNVTISGTKHAYNAVVDADGVTGHKNQNFSVGEEATLVLDANGYVMYIKETIAADNYVFIRQTAQPSGLDTKVVAAAYFTDGTSDEVTLKKIRTDAGAEITGSSMDGNTGWYTFIKNSDGKYTLTELKAADYGTPATKVATFTGNGTTGATVTTNGKVAFSAGLKGNDKTVFVVRDADNDVTVYTGVKQVPDITTSASGTITMSYIVKSSYVKYAFIDAYSDPTASINDATTASGDYMFVLKRNTVNTVYVTNDKGYNEYKVIRGGEVVDVKVDKDATQPIVGGLYHKVKTNADGYLSGSNLIGPAADKVTGSGATVAYSNGALTVGGNEYLVDENSEINLIVSGAAACDDLLEDDDADYETYLDISAKSLKNTLADYTTTYDYFLVLTDDATSSNTIKTLYVYVTSATEI